MRAAIQSGRQAGHRGVDTSLNAELCAAYVIICQGQNELDAIRSGLADYVVQPITA